VERGERTPRGEYHAKVVAAFGMSKMVV